VVQVVVAVGGNVGDVEQTIARAKALVAKHECVDRLRSAELYRSVAMGVDAGESFINSAWAFESSLTPLQLLDLLQGVENELGRTREVQWGPRTLDLDLIFYGDQMIDLPRLVVPHPGCWYRRFVLAPVASLVPEFVHPVTGVTIRELHEMMSRFPFPLGILGEPKNRSTLRVVAREFPRVELREVVRECDIGELGVSIGFEFGDGHTTSNDPFWLHVTAEGERQFIYDVLTAACVDVEPVGCL